MATYTTRRGTAITYTEFIDRANPSPSSVFRISDGQSSATRIIDVAWSDWPRFVEDAVGYTTIKTNDATAQPYISRITPWHAAINDLATERKWLWAVDVTVQGFGKPTDDVMNETVGGLPMARFKTARCTLGYSTLLYDIRTDDALGTDRDESRLDRYVTKIYRPQGEFLNIDGSAYYYGLGTSPAVPLYRGVNKTLISFNVQLTWHKIPEEAVPTKFLNPNATNFAIDRCLGTVNNQDWEGYAKGTLLLMAVEMRPYVSAVGIRYYDLTYSFKFFNPTQETRNNNAIGHQHIFRPRTTPGWYEALGGDTGRTIATSTNPTNFIAQTDNVNIYNWSNFRNLFRPAAATYKAQD
jgi:hypothetical protein